jgi:hypothetical protein
MKTCGQVAAGDGAQHAGRDLLVLRDVGEDDTVRLQHGLGAGAERAARLGEHHDRLARRGVRVDEAQHGVGIRHFERIALLVRLDEDLVDDAVLDQHRIAPGALAEAEVALVDQQAHAFA